MSDTLERVCIASLQAWGLLASTLSEDAFSSDDTLDRCVPRMVALLEHSDADIRSTAATNIALLYKNAQYAGVILSNEHVRELSTDTGKKESSKHKDDR
uniref:Interferon-related developmental regulator N-terminal domain-containing protein n=1 Tax=Globisporangium ultimum (strain ATCC 200006 / CBS 805.95 / DAOM BR144) TaxID=431595 RepID=K3WKD2_GLOUD